MCRWLAYSGSPVRLDDLLYKPANSLVMQSKHSRMGVETTNGDGFGVGWYGTEPIPGVFRSTEPAWHDRNLRELAGQASAGRVFAHIRATTGTAVQQTNCHPFRHNQWLWMHNGVLADFPKLKRDMAMAVEPDLYPEIEGSTDSELFFYLALTFGLERNPRTAVAEAVEFIEDAGRRHGVEHPVQMTVAATNGDTTWAFRYSSEGNSRSLFHSNDIATLQAQHSDHLPLRGLSKAPGSSSRNRWVISAAPGRKYPNPRASSSTEVRSSCTRLHHLLCTPRHSEVSAAPDSSPASVVSITCRHSPSALLARPRPEPCTNGAVSAPQPPKPRQLLR
ncbi:class II glutamine amidotransferase [Nesterenkonia sp. AN1]|uniref:class II glutamine amidotransferase n=1 Tax=Nesterenkonia sp. AN1 TaxID=652017 RepID=UPI0004B64269|nr:class II glutamine amidotransferase [Nesterenkonia sp. AN1]